LNQICVPRPLSLALRSISSAGTRSCRAIAASTLETARRQGSSSGTFSTSRRAPSKARRVSPDISMSRATPTRVASCPARIAALPFGSMVRLSQTSTDEAQSTSLMRPMTAFKAETVMEFPGIDGSEGWRGFKRQVKAVPSWR
jgi:hypothetical protein